MAAYNGGAGPAKGFDLTDTRQFMARPPPPPPPLTPPALSSTIFTFEDRRPSYPHSVSAELDTVNTAASFIHQPNPDYMGSSSSASDPKSSPVLSLPRRRSYTKALPIGMPIHASSAAADVSSSSPEAGVDSFSPSSYPPTSPLLPPPPPGQHETAFDKTDPTGREIDLQGEIISVMDDSGAGWKRHTRVYGGGVCLACIAAGGGGGFYGDKVRPEDRR